MSDLPHRLRVKAGVIAGGEKIAWGKKVIEWKEEKETVLGDCVLCSGIIAYLGAFPITYRD